MKANDPCHQRLTSDLQKGRISLSYARYFITCSSKRPQKRMAETVPALTIKNALKRLEESGDIILLCGTIMPDHVHLLAVLQDKLSIGRVVGKFKALTKISLLQYDIHWQRDFFEHRLRPGEPAANYARYIFLNPYRSNLISRKSEWPHWMKNGETDFDFMPYLEQGHYPPGEWLDAPPEKLGINPQYMGND
jgi:REP element-mobilizing transposase RayT